MGYDRSHLQEEECEHDGEDGSLERSEENPVYLGCPLHRTVSGTVGRRNLRNKKKASRTWSC